MAEEFDQIESFFHIQMSITQNMQDILVIQIVDWWGMEKKLLQSVSTLIMDQFLL